MLGNRTDYYTGLAPKFGKILLARLIRSWLSILLCHSPNLAIPEKNLEILLIIFAPLFGPSEFFIHVRVWMSHDFVEQIGYLKERMRVQKPREWIFKSSGSWPQPRAQKAINPFMDYQEQERNRSQNIIVLPTFMSHCQESWSQAVFQSSIELFSLTNHNTQEHKHHKYKLYWSGFSANIRNPLSKNGHLKIKS